MGTSVDSFADPLAKALWDARERGVTVSSAQAWSDLSRERADDVSTALYQRLGPIAPPAWKMGAFDEETQLRLGLAGPLVAPVLSDRMHVGASTVSLRLRDFAQPKLEAEVGIRTDDGRPTLVPCVEVADCRFADWALPPFAAVADFGLQGAMVFGRGTAPVDEIHVDVSHDGVPVGSGRATWSDAVRRLSVLPDVHGETVYVATGAMTPMFPALPGVWEFDFRGLATLVLGFT
jgi:2-keto-4-pentenoate hydratase